MLTQKLDRRPKHYHPGENETLGLVSVLTLKATRLLVLSKVLSKRPKDLAEFLLELDRIDEKYNKYFEVILKKSCFAYNVLVLVESTGEFINTRLFCRVCALLHQTQVRKEKYEM